MLWHKRENTIVNIILFNWKNTVVNFCWHESTCEKVDVGVPQGLFVRPLLFLLHINDLHNNISLKVLILEYDNLLGYMKIEIKEKYLRATLNK